MLPESKFIKLIAQEVVSNPTGTFPHQMPPLPNTSWESLKKILLYHEMAEFAYIIIKQSAVLPRGIDLDYLKKRYFWQLGNNMQLYAELENLLQEAKKPGLGIIPIKGLTYTKRYYQRFGLRPAVDIDLLVRPQELEQAIRFMESRGYRKNFPGKEDYWRSKQIHLAFIKDTPEIPIVVELHWALDFKRENCKTPYDVWSRLKKTLIGNCECSILSPEDTLIAIALHQRRFGKMLNIKYACDTAFILDREKIDWELLINTACEQSCRASLFFLLAHTQIVLDKDLRKYWTRLNISLWQRKLIFYIIKKYVFSFSLANDVKRLYLLCHFLLYDNITEPARYIINIPLEQFAKFYSLPAYARMTYIKHKTRLIYIPYSFLKRCILSKFGILTQE